MTANIDSEGLLECISRALRNMIHPEMSFIFSTLIAITVNENQTVVHGTVDVRI